MFGIFEFLFKIKYKENQIQNKQPISKPFLQHTNKDSEIKELILIKHVW